MSKQNPNTQTPNLTTRAFASSPTPGNTLQDLTNYWPKKALSCKARKEPWDTGVKKPECLGTGTDCEPFLSKDYHLEVYNQAFRASNARGVIIFTSGNGTAAVAERIEAIAERIENVAAALERA